MDCFNALFTTPSLHTLFRLVVILGGYLLLRPAIQMLFRYLFSLSEQQQDAARVGLDDNLSSRRQTSLADEWILGEEGEDEPFPNGIEEQEERGVEWGTMLRKRQAARFSEYWEAEQARMVDEEDLDDIRDLLED